MANRRMINKDDCELMVYRKMPIVMRYLFDHLMLYADDDGIIPMDYVKLYIFPFDTDVSDADISEYIQRLEMYSFLQMYTGSDNEIYIQILNWWLRQRIQKRFYKPTTHPRPSTYEPRPKHLQQYEAETRGMHQGMNHSLDQSRKDEKSSVKPSEAKVISEKTNSTEKPFNHEEDLPFDNYPTPPHNLTNHEL